MASPIVTLGAAAIGPTAPATTPGAEMVVDGPQQPVAAGATTTAQQPTKDRVELSSTALDLSKALGSRKQVGDRQSEDGLPTRTVQRDEQKPSEPVLQKMTDKPDISLIKQYPPFMGNSEELKRLRSQAPALYRQILRMVVPLPVNISAADAQLLQRPSIDARM